MITTIVTAAIEHYLLYAAILLFLAGGVASWIYVPLVGKQLAVGFFAAAAALSAYQLGYNARAALDKSIELEKQLTISQANLAQAQADLKTNSDIAAASAAREQEQAKTASELQAKVSTYEDQLRDQADDAADTVPGKCPKVKSNGCRLTPADVSGLRGIAGPHAGH